MSRQLYRIDLMLYMQRPGCCKVLLNQKIFLREFLRYQQGLNIVPDYINLLDAVSAHRSAYVFFVPRLIFVSR